MKKKTFYVSPESETIDSLWASTLCTSPGNGQSEDIGYEDWNSLMP